VNNVDVQNYIQPLCKTYGVMMVLSGHNHYYARAVVEGIQHITTGGGGVSLDTPDPTQLFIVNTKKSLEFCKIEIKNDFLLFSVISNIGVKLDSLTIYETPNSEVIDHRNNNPTDPAISNYPNPFNPNTIIMFEHPHDGKMEASIYSVTGAKIKTLATEFRRKDKYSITWDGTNDSGSKMAPGVYFVKIIMKDMVMVQNLMLIQ